LLHSKSSETVSHDDSDGDGGDSDDGAGDDHSYDPCFSSLEGLVLKP
jgi:hypothetical protein